MNWSLRDIAHWIGAENNEFENVEISSIAKIEEGTPGAISFLSNPKYAQYAAECRSSALIVSTDFDQKITSNLIILNVKDPSEAMRILLEKASVKEKITYKIDPTASISTEVKLDKKISIGKYVSIQSGTTIAHQCIIADHVFVGKNVNIGANCIIMPGVKIMHDTIIGKNVIIHPNSVIGSEGFGFQKTSEGNFKKIPQLGNVIIEDNVEIGANVTIDRGSIGPTIIRQGVKLDNLIMVGHNVEIKQNTVIAAQTGIAGSTTIGANCMIGGHVGIVGHANIADGSMIQGFSGVASSIVEKGKKWFGYPAIDYMNFVKSSILFKNLPSIVKDLRKLKKEVDQLKKKD